MVLKKMDALEFVKSLEGGWDCVIWDPPYLEHSQHTVLHSKGSYIHKDRDKRVKISNPYLEAVLNEIKKKTTSFVILKFYNKLLSDADNYFEWYKGKSGAITGNKIINNVEYINVYYDNFKPNYKEIKGVFRVIEYKKNYNQYSQKNLPLEKPVYVYEKLLSYFKPKKVLDPFAGSFNSVKACNRLNIKIDACDKYLDVPYMKKSNLLNYG